MMVIQRMLKPLKNLSNFWKTLEMPLINCEISLNLIWPSTCVITNSTGEGKFAITNKNLYVPVVTLSTQNNARPLEQLKEGFKGTVTQIKMH